MSDNLESGVSYESGVRYVSHSQPYRDGPCERFARKAISAAISRIRKEPRREQDGLDVQDLYFKTRYSRS